MPIKAKPETKPTTKARSKLIWTLTVLIIICSLATGLLVNFFNNLYYTRLLLQANSQSSAAQSELAKMRYDVKQLITSTSGSVQFNCYDLRSRYARNICYQHNNKLS